MDYYQNEAIVEKQKEKLKKLMKENQTLERDVYKRFIIKDNITTMNMSNYSMFQLWREGNPG